ncbi:DUF6082 family protein [Streptomyces lavendulae]|uniref:DUF6082 family protein n=1 Tax=Streptomyces lavendulae TaxID=1914 RepID=UPI0036A859C5
MKTYVVAGAALAVVVAEATRLRQSRQQHREQAHLAIAEMHQRLLADQEANPEMAAVWKVSVPAESDMARAEILHVNRWVSLWGIAHRTGVLTDDSLAGYARNGMQNPAFQQFWTYARTFRIMGARDEIDRTFNATMDQAYQALGRKEKAPAA